MASSLAVSVLGVTGYTGEVLADLLLNHPKAHLVHATSASSGGKPLGSVLGALRGRTDLVLEPPNGLDKLAKDSDVVFSCLPHGESGKAVALIHAANQKAVVIDLSGDLRLKDERLAQKWYGHAEPMAQKAVYGLSEVLGDEIAHAKVVSNPGCYATSALLPLIPVLRAKLGLAKGVVVDSKSGVTGAGKQPTAFTHFGEVAESLKAYKVGEHKHTPEIEQGLALWANASAAVTFTPHLVPMLRGILTTAYLDAPSASAEQAHAALAKHYASRPFVRVLPLGTQPDTGHVWGTNFCDLGIAKVHGKLVLTSALDNLVKGAAGQAVQNMNIALGLPETQGLLPPAKPSRLVAK